MQALPSGPTPQGTSSMRVLPNVHEALRQNDPQARFFSASRQEGSTYIGPCHGHLPSILVQNLQGLVQHFHLHHLLNPHRPAVVPSVELPLAATPMTPSHPASSSNCSTSEVFFYGDELMSPISIHLNHRQRQAPPSKHVRCKAFPKPCQPSDQVYVAASATVEMPPAQQTMSEGSASRVYAYTSRSCVHANELLHGRQDVSNE